MEPPTLVMLNWYSTVAGKLETLAAEKLVMGYYWVTAEKQVFEIEKEDVGLVKMDG